MDADSLEERLALQNHPPHSTSDRDAGQLLAEARTGDESALGAMLEASREYLQRTAVRQLGPDLRARVGISDLIQDTFVDARKNFDQFQGDSQKELVAWLRKILSNNLLNHYRRFRSQKRQISREVRLEGRRVLADMVTDETPSQVLVRREEEQLLHRAMKELSVEHQQVIRLRHLKGLSFVEIGARLGRTPDAARMLWHRAFGHLSRVVDRLAQ